MSDLTPEEQDRVRTALRFLRTRCGGIEPLAAGTRAARDSLRRVLSGIDAVSASLAFRVARLADVAIDDVLDGTYPPAGTCPHCGHAPESVHAPVRSEMSCEPTKREEAS